MIKALDIPIYNTNVLFLVETTIDEFEEFCKDNRDGFTDEEYENAKQEIESGEYSGYVNNLTYRGYICYIRENKVKYYDHELCHVATRILKDRGIGVDDNDEPLAYLKAWITEQYLELVNQMIDEI